jgi:hypothetical protein
MIAMYFHPKYRDNIQNFFKNLNVKYAHLMFLASYHSVYYVYNDIVYCESEYEFKRKYPKVKIIDPKKIYEEY